jgi:NAD(P)-dependent dehydrogenase (short-subunit alcohol dehydrogenase family)
MAIELAPHNIQVNAIAPGWIETDMTAPVRTPDFKAMHDEVMARTPAGRWGQSEEVAGTAVYLASRASQFVTGEPSAWTADTPSADTRRFSSSGLAEYPPWPRP